MRKFNLIVNCKIKWWVKPLISVIKAWVFITRKDINVNRLADFVGHHGVSKKYATKEI